MTKTKEEIAKILKSSRIKAGMDAKEVAEKLIANGSIKSIKSFYNWESGRTQPDADTFMYLCHLYGIKDIMAAFGFSELHEATHLQKSPAPAKAEAGEDTAKVQLLKNYEALNEEGQKKLYSYSDDLVFSGRYTKNNQSEVCENA